MCESHGLHHPCGGCTGPPTKLAPIGGRSRAEALHRTTTHQWRGSYAAKPYEIQERSYTRSRVGGRSHRISPVETEARTAGVRKQPTAPRIGGDARGSHWPTQGGCSHHGSEWYANSQLGHAPGVGNRDDVDPSLRYTPARRAQRYTWHSYAARPSTPDRQVMQGVRWKRRTEQGGGKMHHSQNA